MVHVHSTVQRSLAVVLAVLAVPDEASATPTYPFDIRSALALAYVPPCTVCHAGTPTHGTATTPFAVSMKDRGLVGLSDASVAVALAHMTDERVDSDQNGISDAEQLQAGCDPSTDVAISSQATCSGGTSDVAPLTGYGCDVQMPLPPGSGQGFPGDGVPWQATALLTGVAAGLVRRRRR